MRDRRFFFFFRRSVAQRRGRNVIAALSVTLAVAVVTGMAGITGGVREKLGAELKAYGANVIVSPAHGGTMPWQSVDRIRQIPGIDEAAGQVFGSAKADGTAVEVIGLELARFRDRGWRLFGRWPEQDGQVLAGVNLRQALKLREGDGIELASDRGSKQLLITGFVEKGGSEDSAFVMSLEDAWAVLGNSGAVSAVLVRAEPSSLETAVSLVRSAVPDATVKTVRQVAFAEESLLAKIQLLMALVTVIVVFAASVGVASTMGANVLERREEIGLMKALGATRRDIRSFFLVEALMIGVAGSLAGFLFGLLAAEAVSHGAFGTLIRPAAYLPLVSLATGIVLSLGASYFPVRGAMRYDPAVILRGE